jgi:hypothetical protein
MKLFSAPRWLYAACLLTLALPVWAESEQDLARDAVRAGEVMPLDQVLREVEKTSPGKVLKVELEQRGGRWVYEIKLLRDNGTLSKLCFDARDGTLLKSGSRHGNRGDHGWQWDHRGAGGREGREGE